jgi:hypothetical protein
LAATRTGLDFRFNEDTGTQPELLEQRATNKGIRRMRQHGQRNFSQKTVAPFVNL